MSSYYSEAAYNSSKAVMLPGPENHKFSNTVKRLRKNPLPRFSAAQCKEFLSIDEIEIIKLLNSDDEDVLRNIKSNGHEKQKWQTLKNPKAVFETIIWVMFFVSIPAWVGFFLVSAILFFKHPDWILSPHFLLVALIPVVPTAIHLLGRYLLNKGLIADKNNIVLSRREGTILLPIKKNPTQKIPFQDFDAYLGTSLNSSGLTCYHLWLCHRYSEQWLSHPGEFYDEWKVSQEWEFWQQYMDVSKPLPDTPQMEPFRSRDPVTAAYDKEHSRPVDYWKNMELCKAEEMRDASLEAGSKYPWGVLREQALAQGWQPSGVGEGDWHQKSQPNEQTHQADAI